MVYTIPVGKKVVSKIAPERITGVVVGSAIVEVELKYIVSLKKGFYAEDRSCYVTMLVCSPDTIDVIDD